MPIHALARGSSTAGSQRLGMRYSVEEDGKIQLLL